MLVAQTRVARHRSRQACKNEARRFRQRHRADPLSRTIDVVPQVPEQSQVPAAAGVLALAPRRAAPAVAAAMGAQGGPRWRAVADAVLGNAGDRVVVRQGDTLWKLVSQRLQVLGRDASVAAVRQGVKDVAAVNGIADPGRIFVADTLDFSALRRGAASPAAAGAAMPAAPAAAPVAPRFARAAAPAPAPASTAPAPARSSTAPEAGALLEATLARAVRKGYVPAADVDRVRERIQRIAAAQGFTGDDLAQVALMESDGFNPRASNGRCFGILQFCEGEGRGADSVGMRGRAAEITSRSVWEQLGFVERYLADVGGASTAPKALDDLYLAVLMPAARAQTSAQAALEIPGRQARLLHEGGDRARPITRDSLMAGLRLNAQQLLAADGPSRPAAAASGNPAVAQRQGLAAVALYEGVVGAGLLALAGEQAR